MRLVIAIIISIFLICCKSNLESKSVNSDKNDSTIIKLDYGFEIEIIDKTTLNEYGVYTKIGLRKNNKVIYIHDNVDEIPFKLFTGYIYYNKTNDDYDVLVIGRMLPNKDWLNKIRIKKDSVISISKIPVFECSAKDIDNDNKLEMFGYLQLKDVSREEQGKMTEYNPIIIYEISETGLNIDSIYTQIINRKIYGDFFGYQYGKTKLFDSSVNHKHDSILKILINKKQ